MISLEAGILFHAYVSSEKQERNRNTENICHKNVVALRGHSSHFFLSLSVCCFLAASRPELLASVPLLSTNYSSTGFQEKQILLPHLLAYSAVPPGTQAASPLLALYSAGPSLQLWMEIGRIFGRLWGGSQKTAQFRDGQLPATHSYLTLPPMPSYSVAQGSVETPVCRAGVRNRHAVVSD